MEVASNPFFKPFSEADAKGNRLILLQVKDVSYVVQTKEGPRTLLEYVV